MNLTSATNKMNILNWFWKKDQKNTIKFSLLSSFLFVISAFAVCFLTTLSQLLVINIISLCISLAVILFVVFKFNLLEIIFNKYNLWFLVISWILAAPIAFSFVKSFSTIHPPIYAELFDMGAEKIIGYFALLAVFVYTYAFISRFWEFLKLWISKRDRIDYIYIFVIGIILSVILSYVYSTTTAFHLPVFFRNPFHYDVLFTTDSGELVSSNVYQNIAAPENDLRQPLFGLFAMPFAIVATVISEYILFNEQLYNISLGVVQIFLLLFSIVTIGGLMPLSKMSKAMFYGVFTVSFPFLFFSVCAEQYIFALFWIVVLIYVSFNNLENKDFALIAACGSLLTSGVLIPLTYFSKNIKSCLLQWFKTALKFFAACALFGRLTVFIDIVSNISHLSEFSGAISVSILDKLLQYINFVANTIISPIPHGLMTPYGYPAFRLQEINFINIFGVAIIIVVILGFIFNRKNKFYTVCFMWVVFSFVLLFGFGWGTPENGLTLYTLYFSWAFVPLIFAFFEHILLKFKNIRITLYSLLIILLIWFNFNQFSRILNFAYNYFSVM